jgi:glyoxylase-like metal-dependent hydrolase (beta-lactamase superfamily II)
VSLAVDRLGRGPCLVLLHGLGHHRHVWAPVLPYLVVETGMGPRNAEKVLEFAADYAKGRKLFLTTTHFHPEHAFGAQVFTGDLVEAGQFAIFPWFPPYDTDVLGTRWLAVMQRLAAEGPRVVVPGHGAVGGPRLLADVRDYLQLLRDETWVRRDSAMSEQTIIEEISALVIQRHPDWAGQEWIEKGVSCLCSEHPA